MCWPSFNAVLVEGVARHRAIVNTYYAIVTSCVTSCAFSSLMTKESKLSMVSAASDNFQLSRQNSFTTFIFVLINIPYTVCMFLKSIISCLKICWHPSILQPMLYYLPQATGPFQPNSLALVVLCTTTTKHLRGLHYNDNFTLHCG